MTTREEYEAYRRSLYNRDEKMAQCVINEMERLSESADVQPKCLVVMNYRHGFDLTGRSPEARRINTFEFLKDDFGDRAANVLLNCRLIIVVPIAGGLWDMAFEETGNRLAGFDFKGSPFGEDPFDMFPFLPGVRGKLKYRDVFTGFVYTHPLDEHYLQHGVPGFYDGFEEEILRRATLISKDYLRGTEFFIARTAKGLVPMKEELPGYEIQSFIEIFLLGFTGIGLFIGIGAFALGQRHRKDECREATGDAQCWIPSAYRLIYYLPFYYCLD